jgi:hypothetical protein
MGSHFKGLSVFEHLKEARKKGHLASSEPHGVEAIGHLIGGADAAREIAMTSLLLAILFFNLNISLKISYSILSLFLLGLFFWKVGRSASLGWSRLERINKLIEDEKEEIENNRAEEKSELTEIYAAKGFSEPLLSKVIDVLMADDNKLLGIMLEEELGVSLESNEHPLKQALGTATGFLLAAGTIFASILLFSLKGIFIAAPLIIMIASALMAKVEKIRILHQTVWNLSITFLAGASTYFLCQFFVKL